MTDDPRPDPRPATTPVGPWTVPGTDEVTALHRKLAGEPDAATLLGDLADLVGTYQGDGGRTYYRSIHTHYFDSAGTDDGGSDVTSVVLQAPWLLYYQRRGSRRTMQTVPLSQIRQISQERDDDRLLATIELTVSWNELELAMDYQERQSPTPLDPAEASVAGDNAMAAAGRGQGVLRGRFKPHAWVLGADSDEQRAALTRFLSDLKRELGRLHGPTPTVEG